MSPKRIKILAVVTTVGVIAAAVVVILAANNNHVKELLGLCQGNANPVFTHSPADLSKIDYIVPPGNVEPYEDGSRVLKTHSYFKGSNKVAVRAPIDSNLFRGTYVTEGGINQYALFFEVSCEVFYILDHIVDPTEAIKDAFPGTPQATTETMETSRVEVKAGELVGYSIGEAFEQWDFGVYNNTRSNDFGDLDKDIPIYDRDKIADCPFDYFSEELRQQFYAKFGNHLTGVPIPDRFCKTDRL